MRQGVDGGGRVRVGPPHPLLAVKVYPLDVERKIKQLQVPSHDKESSFLKDIHRPNIGLNLQPFTVSRDASI